MRFQDIRESDVLTAIPMNDLDDACRYLQGIAGITDDGVAAMTFSGFDWVHADRDEREVMVRNWIRIEAAYADQPDPWPDAPLMENGLRP
jgi:hypothetical protein